MDPYDSDCNDFLQFNLINHDTSSDNKIKASKKTRTRRPKEKSKPMYDDISCLCVVDLDDTLIDKHNRIIDGAKKFLIRLNTLNHNGFNILWSLGNNAHVMQQWDSGFSKFFDNVIIGYPPGMKDNGKPITYAKKYCTNPNAFMGPSIIIDNDPSNIRKDQYDITINVSKFFINKPGMPLAIDYNSIYNTLVPQVEDWYMTYFE